MCFTVFCYSTVPSEINPHNSGKGWIQHFCLPMSKENKKNKYQVKLSHLKMPLSQCSVWSLASPKHWRRNWIAFLLSAGNRGIKLDLLLLIRKVVYIPGNKCLLLCQTINITNSYIRKQYFPNLGHFVSSKKLSLHMWINVIQAKLESRNCWSLVLLAANTPGLRCCMGFRDYIFGILAVCKCAVASSFATVSNVPFAPSPSTLSAAYSKYRVCTPLTDFSGVMVPGGCRSQSCHGSLHTTIP